MSDQFSDLKGKTLIKAEAVMGGEVATFVTNEGETYKLAHYQDCCEIVDILDISGDMADLIGSPILLAEEVTHRGESPPEVAHLHPGADDSYTWTFYKLATIKGSVTIRWFGTSNGYYSESVDFYRVAE